MYLLTSSWTVTRYIIPVDTKKNKSFLVDITLCTGFIKDVFFTFQLIIFSNLSPVLNKLLLLYAATWLVSGSLHYITNSSKPQMPCRNLKNKIITEWWEDPLVCVHIKHVQIPTSDSLYMIKTISFHFA